MIRWRHSAAQLGDVVTEDSDTARALWELFVRRGFSDHHETVQNVDLTFVQNQTMTSLQSTFHEIQRVSRYYLSSRN